MFIADEYPKRIDLQIDSYDTLPDFSIKIGGAIVLSSDVVCQYMYNTYGNYKTLSPLFTLWGMYYYTHIADLSRAWDAWTATYNPLDNYNGTETTVRQHMDGEDTETITHGKTTTNTANNVTNETQTTSVDNDNYRPDTKNTQSGSTTSSDSGTTTTTRDRTTKSLTIGDTTYTADIVEGETRERHGNLGVTTSQQMITSEIEMRKNPLLLLFIDEFISTYAYYIGGGFNDPDYI